MPRPCDSARDGAALWQSASRPLHSPGGARTQPHSRLQSYIEPFHRIVRIFLGRKLDFSVLIGRFRRSRCSFRRTPGRLLWRMLPSPRTGPALKKEPRRGGARIPEKSCGKGRHFPLRRPYNCELDPEHSSSASPRLRVVPGIHVFSDLILGDALALLNLALELIPFAVDGSEIIVGEVPHFSLTLPFICFQFPSTQFQSISISFACFTTNGAWLKSFRGTSATGGPPLLVRLRRGAVPQQRKTPLLRRGSNSATRLGGSTARCCRWVRAGFWRNASPRRTSNCASP